MSAPRITVGLPVYKGADLIAKTLNCLQRQTFSNFEAIISVDGGDAETAAACRPFLADPRFRMVVHPKRLDWVGNFNWLLQQDLREFFCYRQHDDTTAPEFFEVLLQAADKEPNAAAIYCDFQWMGGHNEIEITPSIRGRTPGSDAPVYRAPTGNAVERSYTQECYRTSWPREDRRIPGS